MLKFKRKKVTPKLANWALKENFVTDLYEFFLINNKIIWFEILI